MSEPIDVEELRRAYEAYNNPTHAEWCDYLHRKPAMSSDCDCGILRTSRDNLLYAVLDDLPALLDAVEERDRLKAEKNSDLYLSIAELVVKERNELRAAADKLADAAGSLSNWWTCPQEVMRLALAEYRELTKEPSAEYRELTKESDE